MTYRNAYRKFSADKPLSRSPDGDQKEQQYDGQYLVYALSCGTMNVRGMLILD